MHDFPALTLAIYCVAILFSSLGGGLVPLVSAVTHARLQTYLSVSAGVMLGTAFFHMLPEGIQLLGRPEEALEAGLAWLAAGLLGLFFVERFFAFHHHEVGASDHAAHASGDERPKYVDLSWGPATVGFCLHTLAGGVALGSATQAGSRVGLLVFLATVLHKPADSLTIVALMLGSGAARRRAHLVNLGFALMVPLGVALFFLSRSALTPSFQGPFTGGALAFSAGTFLCIALSDLLPELQFHEHDRLKLSIALLAGVLLMFLAAQLARH